MAISQFSYGDSAFTELGRSLHGPAFSTGHLVASVLPSSSLVMAWDHLKLPQTPILRVCLIFGLISEPFGSD
jgi:hypothetical protein